MKIKYLIIILLCVCFVNITYVQGYDKDITLLAEIIDRNVDDPHRKVIIIDSLVDELINYEFYYYSKGITRTWKDKTGDCTDRAMLKQYMLGRINVRARLVHGYNMDNVKHDWFEYNINNTWYNLDINSDKKGNGVW